MFMFSQFLVSILVILGEYCLNLCISMALPEIIERLQMNSFMYTVQPKHRNNNMQEERRNFCWIWDIPPLTICSRKSPTSKRSVFMSTQAINTLITNNLSLHEQRLRSSESVILTLWDLAEVHQSLTCLPLAADSLKCHPQYFFLVLAWPRLYGSPVEEKRLGLVLVYSSFAFALPFIYSRIIVNPVTLQVGHSTSMCWMNE